MASIALTTAATAATSSASAALTQLAVQAATTALTSQLFNRPSNRHTEGARLEELAVQTSTYGKVIPQVVGSMRLGGNVIWSQPIHELATTSTTTTGGGKGGGIGGGGGSSTSTQTSYNYNVTLAIAIAEGPIASVDRVWADAKLLDLSQGTYRIHLGSEDQLPDPAIEAIHGTGETPGYRGTAYVVIENFPLGDFGNRIPNFSFEITRHIAQTDIGSEPIEHALRSVVLLPGSGEYVYDTTVQEKREGVTVGEEFYAQGYRDIVNQHTFKGKANALVAVDHLVETFPNLEWVAILVNWFGTSMDIQDCEFFPAVEFNTSTRMSPNPWGVAGYTRDTARLVGADDEGNPRYGGTPDDGSILRLIIDLKARGLKVFFYPMPLMDVADKPWRGRLSGAIGDVPNFFTRSNGYNRFIEHYANLVKDKVDAFAIGTEMKALTAITNGQGSYPAVDALVSLAQSVKQTMGSATKITYAADWSEYHHTDNGWYHLDPLWASSSIDMVGIDAYFPLTDAPQSQITQQMIEDGWREGEGYDWYYADSARTDQQPLGAAYAWKNIEWWCNNTHTNPNGQQTPWVAGSKPVWFAEFGFPSVDGCSNQPNVFIDPTSSENAYPRFSNKRIDFAAQRNAIIATEKAWQNSSIVTERFLWAWDARPYPAWPDLRDVWADGGNWITGHWVQGKLGTSEVAAFLRELLTQAGLPESAIDVSEINQKLDGFVLNKRSTVRAICEQLQLSYGFDLLESEGVLKAIPRGNVAVATLDASECVPQTDSYAATQITRSQETDLPKRIEVSYLDRSFDYNVQLQASSRETTEARDTETISLSMVLSEQTARSIADIRLHERWQQRTAIESMLPVAYAYLEPGDVIIMREGNSEHRLKVTQTQFGRPGLVKIKTVSESQEVFAHYVSPVSNNGISQFSALARTEFEALDIPALPGERGDEHVLRGALHGDGNNWPGGIIQRVSQSTNARFEVMRSALPARMGTTIGVLPEGDAQLFDRASSVEVVLLGEGELFSATEISVLNGANAALIGNEIIQFSTAEPLANQRYRLSGFLRGRLGTEAAISNHAAGERFVMLDDALSRAVLPFDDLGKNIALEGVTFGAGDNAKTEASITYQAACLRPYAPVHVRLSRDANGDVTANWVRRARINAGWIDGIDVPLDEARERYRITVLHNGDVVHQADTDTAHYIYTAQQQLIDTGQATPTLRLRIAQLSERVGEGQAAEQEI